jgi:hypothetical protein
MISVASAGGTLARRAVTGSGACVTCAASTICGEPLNGGRPVTAFQWRVVAYAGVVALGAVGFVRVETTVNRLDARIETSTDFGKAVLERRG